MSEPKKPMTATEKVVLELLAKGVPMDVIEEGIRIASKRVAADIVSGRFATHHTGEAS